MSARMKVDEAIEQAEARDAPGTVAFLRELRAQKVEFEDDLRAQAAADPAFARDLLDHMRRAGPSTRGLRLRVFGEE